MDYESGTDHNQFFSRDADIIEHLQNIKTNRTISSYVRHLIRQDMLGDSPVNNLDKLADKIASKLANSNVSLSLQKENLTEIVVSLEDKSIINSLF